MTVNLSTVTMTIYHEAHVHIADVITMSIPHEASVQFNWGKQDTNKYVVWIPFWEKRESRVELWSFRMQPCYIDRDLLYSNKLQHNNLYFI